MAKQSEKKSDVTVYEPAELPDYLNTESPEGIGTVGEYQTTPRIKIVEGMSSPELKDEYGEGTLVVMPDGVPVAKVSEPFQAIPVIFWPSWVKYSDLKDTSSAVRVAQTLDPRSELAQLSRNHETRRVPYDNQPDMFWTHSENLNFIIEICTGPAEGMVAALEYSRGRYLVGQRLCGYLKRRGCHIYANRLQFESGRTTNRQNQSWYEVDFVAGNPPFVSKNDIERLAKLHSELQRVYDAGEIGVADEEAVGG
jgi:hypothetical protein